MRISKFISFLLLATIFCRLVYSKTLSTGQEIPDPLPPDTLLSQYWELAAESLKVYRAIDSEYHQEVTIDKLPGRHLQYTILSKHLQKGCEFKLSGKASYVRMRKKNSKGRWGVDPSGYEISIYIGKIGDCTVRFEFSQKILAYSTVNCNSSDSCIQKSQNKLIRVFNK